MRSTTLLFAFALAAASSASSASASVANPNCASLTVPNFVNTLGNADGYPYNEDATQIISQDVDTVSFSVSQLWMDAGTPMVAVQYKVEADGVTDGPDTDTQWTCDMNAPESGGIEYDSTQEYTAQCVKGFAEVGIFVFVGGGPFDINAYDACTLPNDEDYVGYSIALPCVPVCAPQVPDCFDGPTVSLADVGYEPTCLYEETPIMTEITGLKENSVEFNIKNTWPTGAVSALSIHYKNTDGDKVCDTFTDMETFESSTAIEAMCGVNGIAEIGIQIHSTGIGFISSISHDECNVPTGDDMGHCSYEFVIPCKDGKVCTDDTPSPSAAPTEEAPPNCVELTQPIIDEIEGNNNVYTGVDELEIAPITIISQNVDAVTIKVTQSFNTNGIPMMAVGYQGSESNEKECDLVAPEGKVDYNFGMDITAQCNMGYAVIQLYLYVGTNEFVVEDYEACTLPNKEDYVKFNLAVPCTPVCKPETPDCLDGSMVVLADIALEPDCLYEDMPIVINEVSDEYMNPNSVEFNIQNTWSNADISSISVSYKEKGSGELKCETFDFNDDAEFIQASCENGIATVIVEVHSTEINYIANLLSPNSCATPTIGTCAYEMVIPCDPKLECDYTDAPTGNPSESPSGSYFPSSAPSATPTKSPAPSSSPTVTPTTVPTRGPTDKPTDGPTDKPSLSPTATPTTVPTRGPTDKPTDGPTATPTTVPSSGPTDGPTTTIKDIKDCVPSDPILISNDGETMYPYSPLIITFQNTTHVAFKVENSFGSTVSSIYTEYHKTGLFGETECVEEENVDKNFILDEEFLAQCTHNSKISVVNVWMTDCSTTTSFLDQTDKAEIPQCCHPGEQCRTVQYTFKLNCVSPCIEEDVSRRNLHASTEGARRNLHVLAEKIHEDPEANDEEQSFCVNADYPCGPDTDNVHVCHYSARDGYKTFCVPESDSDALRFYPKDYCGPCVGGYTSS